jgi:predicted FMN-binding regulatory protein PaiB
MYLPKHFEERDPERLRSFVQRYPLGSLVTATESGWMRTTFPSCLPTPGARLERFTATLLVRTRLAGGRT